MSRAHDAEPTGLGFLADGVVGHHVGVQVGAGQDAPWTDGRTIHVASGAGSDLRLAILVQAALIAAGSIDPRIMLRLVGRTALTRRYLVLEARRAVLACADRLPRRLLDHPELAPLPVSSNAAEQSLRIAQEPDALPEPGVLLGIMRPGSALRDAARSRTAGSRQGNETGRAKARQEPMLGEDEDAKGSKILDKFSNPLGGGGPLADFFKRLIGMGAQRGTDGTMASGAGEDRADGGGYSIERGGALLSSGGAIADRAQPARDLSTAARYPEWDVHAGRYRRDHVQVEEFVPWDEERAPGTERVLAALSTEMQRQVMRLGLGFERHRRQPAGDEIVIDDVVRLVADLSAGQAGDQRIYRGLRKTRRDLGVLVLVDCSASTADTMPDGDTILDRQLAIAWQLASALDRAGDRVAFYGFNSWGRERVHMLRVKSFDDPIGAETRRRVALLPPVGFTRIGSALRHAAGIVRDRSGMPFRLIVLVTDGLSYDDGYEAAYGEADTRKAIAELHADHIGTLCLSVGGEADDRKLRRVFGSAAFLREDRPAAMTRQIGRMLGTAMAGVAHR